MSPPLTVPLPFTETVSATVWLGPPLPVNAAVTLLSLVIVTVHDVIAPAHEPPQPVKPAPEPATADSVTGLFAATVVVQPLPPADVPAMPPPVTVPWPG